MENRERSGRRSFLKSGMLAAGSAALGAVGAAVAADRGEGGSESCGAHVLALTTDGRLVRARASEPASKTATRRGRTGEEARTGMVGRKWVMVIDLAKCDGCKSCTAACGKMHFTPPDREWIRVFTMRDSRDTAPYWFPKPCFHCDNPPCTKVCPVDASFKRKDGIVLIDNERCIGCRFCMAACPYSTRFFNWGAPDNPPEAAARGYSPEYGYPRRIGTVEKCDFCPEMAEHGKLPACVAACAMGALYYGDQKEDAVTNGTGETQRLSDLLAERAAYRYLEDLGTEPRVYYLPPKQRMYPLPGTGRTQGVEGR